MESFLTESIFYIIAAGFLQCVGALIVAPFFFPIARRLNNLSFSAIFRAYFVFNVFLLLWGCVGHYVFLSITFGKLYVSIDRLVDWYPFIPFGQWVLDQNLGEHHRGHLIGGATLGQLRFIWFAIAAPAWALTYLSTSITLRLGFRRTAAATGHAPGV